MAAAQRKKTQPRPILTRAMPVAADGQPAVPSPAKAMQTQLAALFDAGAPAASAARLPRARRLGMMFYAGLLAWAVVLAGGALIWKAAAALL